MQKLAEAFEQHKDERPDKWTLAWWNEQFRDVVAGYRGATHAINRAIAEICDAREEAAALKSRIAELERDAASDRAKIGELAARVDKIAAFATELKSEREAKKGK